tara:strand:- start:392 stop:688 length:297 start_codon:yes stop_codon:yes gene_type:complete
MARTPYKMKGSPMQRNFGIGEKETPLKVLPVVAPVAAAVSPWLVAGATAAVGAGTSAKLAADKKVADDKRIAEQKREQALKEASDSITNKGKDKDRLA